MVWEQFLMQQRFMVIGYALVAGVLLVHQAAHAGRPMEVDDAGIVDYRSCQLEAWSEHRKSSDGYWAMPACNLTGNLELAVGGALEHPDQGANTKALAIEAKTLLAEALGGSTGVALSFAFERQRFEGDDENEWALNLPITTFFAQERLAWHNNIGTVYAQEEKHYVFTWGTGAEYALTERVSLYGEVFGDSTERPFYQVSTGYWVVPEQLQFTLGVGDKLEGNKEERWVSIGVNIVSLPF